MHCISAALVDQNNKSIRRQIKSTAYLTRSNENQNERGTYDNTYLHLFGDTFMLALSCDHCASVKARLFFDISTLNTKHEKARVFNGQKVVGLCIIAHY